MFHEPVMLQEVLGVLACKPGGVYIDGTVGGGGHAHAILEASAPDGVLIGIDRDREALIASEERLKAFGRRKILVRGNYADLVEILAELNIGHVDGILLDLGVSSYQLDKAGRGFSFSADAPLDMRMDQESRMTAGDLVNLTSEKDLKKIIRMYGEEPMAGRIARGVVMKRSEAPIRTTAELADVVRRAVPAARRRGKIHPATRTFQALRIAVNDELFHLRKVILSGIEVLACGGRFCIISFHSLEDRIVKESFRNAQRGCVCPPGMALCNCREKPRLKVLTKRPIMPAPHEIGMNPRARSARLRTAERV